MKKICIFCGEPVDEKTKEHIIPQWLINLTGDPKRRAFFGFDLNPDIPQIRKFSFNSFTFPSCSACNNKYSDLEASAQRVITSILYKEAIDRTDLNILLDWLDKIRIGLWLGFLLLSKNAPGITPRFYINRRLCAADRMLFIYEIDTERKGINFIGTESPSFLQVPSSFALLINNFCFFNVSHFNLCDRRLGFPYAKTAYYKNLENQIEADYTAGFHRVFFPIIREQYLPLCSKFFQPIFSNIKKFDGADKLLSTKYVKQNSIDWEEGIGNIFHEKKTRAVPFPEQKTLGWIPPASNSMQSFLPRINKQVYDFQISIITNAASIEKLPKNEKRLVKKYLSFWKRANKMVVQSIEEQSKRLGL